MHKDSTKIKIGSLTACYNAAPFFRDCFEGILKQTRKIDFIAIVDDCSTDASREVIRDCVDSHHFSIVQETPDFYVAQKNGVEICVQLRKKNGGPAATRNNALQYLKDRTHFICIADADDILYPTKIDKSLNVALKYPHVALVYSDYDTVNTATGLKAREYKEPFSFRRLFEECIVSNNSFIATNIFNQVGVYDESLFGPEDYDLWLRIADVAAVYHIPEALYQYRITGNNITVTTPNQKFAEHVVRVKQKAMERRNARKE